MTKEEASEKHMAHINNVMSICKASGKTPTQLLNEHAKSNSKELPMDYFKQKY